MDLNTIEKIQKVIWDSDNVVMVSGSEVFREGGLNGLRAEHIVYDIEQKYGFSGEEIVTSQIYSRQVAMFFEYYKDIILNKEKPDNTTVYDVVAKLEKEGKITNIVTRMVYDFYEDAGCEHIVKLYGSVEENRCPACGKIYNSKYIKQAKGTPKCSECGVILRPGFSLFGEQIDNKRLTHAVDAIEGADVLLVAGISLNSFGWQNMLRYYDKDKLVLINTEEKIGDERANYRLYGSISDIFAKLAKEAEKNKKEESAKKAKKSDSKKSK